MLLGLNYLYDYATQVNTVVIDADNSSDRIDQTEQEIADYKEILMR